MENLDTFLAFLSWVLYWMVMVVLVAFVLMVVAIVVTQSRFIKKVRQHIPDPTEWLTVMSSERWNTREELAQLMNTKHKALLFKFRHLTVTGRGFLPAHSVLLILEDLAYLEANNLIENRTMFYDKNKKEYPELAQSDFCIRDETGFMVGFDMELLRKYTRRDEYRRVYRSGKIHRTTKKIEADEALPALGELHGSSA